VTTQVDVAAAAADDVAAVEAARVDADNDARAIQPSSPRHFPT
jgi:hypothetical protein